MMGVKQRWRREKQTGNTNSEDLDKNWSRMGNEGGGGIEDGCEAESCDMARTAAVQ